MREVWWLALAVAAGTGTVRLGLAVVVPSSAVETSQPWCLDGAWGSAIALIFGAALTSAALWRWRLARRRRQREMTVRLEDMATRDELTGLPNRRGFMEKLQQQSLRAVKWDWPIAILVVDLDHFGLVNDRFGEPVGDQVLAAAAQVLRESAGPLDNVARLFSDFFAVAAVGADLGQAKDLADRIVRGFRTNDWEKVQSGLTCTCSVGAAVAQPNRTSKPIIDDLGAMIDDADRALREVKQHGRNGYLCAEDLLHQEGEPTP